MMTTPLYLNFISNLILKDKNFKNDLYKLIVVPILKCDKGIGASDTSRNSQAPARCPTIQFDSDTVYLENV